MVFLGMDPLRRVNIEKTEEPDFKELAKILFAASDESLADLQKAGKYYEVKNEK